MDIHKPKPWHGLREFLKEYLIIVIGVLTALGAEQAVEAVHTAQKATEAEALVREELAVDLAFAADRARYSPCYQAHLIAAQRLLLASVKDGRVGRLPQMILGTRPFSWNQWQRAVSSGIAGHFPAERRVLYQRLYLVGAADGGESLNARQNIEIEAGARLATLILPPRPIDVGTREQLLQAARLANYEERAIEGNARHFVEVATPLHLPPANISAQVILHTEAETRACVDAVAAVTADLPPLPAPLKSAWNR
jgi:hypothetical protein